MGIRRAWKIVAGLLIVACAIGVPGCRTDGAPNKVIELKMPSGVTVKVDLNAAFAETLPFDSSKLTITVVDVSTAPKPTPSDLKNLGGALLEIEPSGELPVRVPLEVTIPPKLIPAGAVPGIAFYDEKKKIWIPETVRIEKVSADGSQKIIGRLSHFSKWGIFSLPARVKSVKLTLPKLGKHTVGIELEAWLPNRVFAKLVGSPFFKSWNISKRNGSNAWVGTVNVPRDGIYRFEILEGNWQVWEQNIRVGGALEPASYKALALKYAPVLSFHNDEEYTPIPLDKTYFSPAKIDVPHTFPSKDMLAGTAAMEYLATHGHNRGIIHGERSGPWVNTKKSPALFHSTGYWVAQRSGKHLFLTYWFFYSHDPKDGKRKSWLVAIHNRDRESVTVVLDEPTGKPVAMLFHGHLASQKMQRADIPGGHKWGGGFLAVKWDDVERASGCTHPIAHVAKGSHAFYPRQGKYNVYIPSLSNTRPVLNEPAGGTIRHCPAGSQLSGCTRTLNLLPLGVGNELSYGQRWQHLSFSGFWIDVPWPSDNVVFPPFISRMDDIPAWNGISLVDATKGIGKVGGSCFVSGARCGDKIKNGSEQCDGSQLGGKKCVSFVGYTGGSLKCNTNCTFDKKGCFKCGDGRVTGGEKCDSNAVACTSLGGHYSSGTAKCKPDCSGYDERPCLQTTVAAPQFTSPSSCAITSSQTSAKVTWTLWSQVGIALQKLTYAQAAGCNGATIGQKQVRVLPASARTATIAGLQPNTWYKIHVETTAVAGYQSNGYQTWLRTAATAPLDAGTNDLGQRLDAGVPDAATDVAAPTDAASSDLPIPADTWIADSGPSDAASVDLSSPDGGSQHHIWSKGFGSVGSDVGRAIAIDKNGNTYVTGQFSKTVNFGGGAITNSGFGGVFVASYTAGGTHRWSKGFGGPGLAVGRAIAVDSAGNVYVTGSFTGTADLGGGPLTSAGSSDIFVASYTSSGAHRFSKRFGGTVGADDIGYALVVDASSNIYVTGQFWGTADFGGGSLTSAGYSDVFIASYTSSGAHRFSKRFGGTTSDDGRGIAIDSGGNIYLTGSFTGSADFGGGAIVSAGSFDVFLASYTSSGVHRFSQCLKKSYTSGLAIAVDGSNVYLTGYSNALGARSAAFLYSFTSTGQHRFSRSLSSTSSGNDISIDSSGNIYLIGSFTGAVDFGGGVKTSTGGYDTFLASYTPSNQHRFSWTFGASEGNALKVDATGKMYIIGAFEQAVDFGGGTLPNAGSADVFLTKLSP